MKFNILSVLIVSVFGLFLTSGCADAIDEEESSQAFEIARSGRWRAPAPIESAAKHVRVKRVTRTLARHIELFADENLYERDVELKEYHRRKFPSNFSH